MSNAGFRDNTDSLLDDFSTSSRKYPSPMFDPLSWSIPTMKTALMWARRLYRIDPLIQGTIRKLATYPITDLVVVSKSEKLKTKVQSILKNTGMRKFMMSVGIDFFCYGNSFISVFPGVYRKVTCRKCGKESAITEFSKLTWRRGELLIHCVTCEGQVEHDIKDIKVKSSSQVKLLRWNPEYVNIKFNPITGLTQYIYTINRELKKNLTSDEVFYYWDTPMDFIKAAQREAKIVLNQNLMYHMKRESLGDDIGFWGEPMSFCLFRDIYYFYVNKKAQEIMAHERIIPLRLIYPSNPQGVSPDLTIRLGNWKNNIEQIIAKWRRDPNYMPIVPFPLGYQEIGGDARGFSLWPELSAAQSRIMLGLGVPPEFLMSGSWSGGSISVRMIENLMLNYRIEQEEMVMFILGQILPMEGLDPQEVSVHLTNFKMADDIQFKQLAFELNQANKVSDEFLLGEMGIDIEEDYANIQKDMSRRADMTVKAAQADAKAVMERMKAEMQGQVLAQGKGQQTANAMSVEGTSQVFLPEMLKGIAMQIPLMPPSEQSKILKQMQKQTPNLYNIVKSQLLQNDATPTQDEQKQLPDQKPPRRTEKKVI
jgi:hypothetical protein